MSSGTKVRLTIIGLFVGVLVLYYGFVMPRPNLDGAAVSDPALDLVQTPVNGESRKPIVGPASGSPSGQESQPKSAAQPGKNPERPSNPAAASGAPSIEMGELFPADAMPKPAMPVRTASPGADTASAADRAAGRRTPPPSTNTPVALPGTRTSPPAATRQPTQTYVVKSGDTLSSIAQHWFGDGSKWDLIVDANPGMDAHRLKLGQRIVLPARTATRSAVDRSARGATTHIVRSGDSLSSIAKMYYGEATRWRKIYDANRSQLYSPDDLSTGQKLVIPGRTETSGK